MVLGRAFEWFSRYSLQNVGSRAALEIQGLFPPEAGSPQAEPSIRRAHPLIVASSE
jgi:hypothetical protein